jgi:hypothetical protein
VNRTRLASMDAASKVPWEQMVIGRKMSANQIAREIGREGKWVFRYSPPELRTVLRVNGAERQVRCMRQAAMKRWGHKCIE